MRNILRSAALLALLLAPELAWAQSQAVPGSAFSSQASTTLSVSTTSAQASLSAYPWVQVQNPTSATACLAWGDNPIAGFPCPAASTLAPGQVNTFPVLGAAKLAGVLASGSGTLSIGEGYFAPGGPPVSATITGPLPAGTNVIGKVGIDQTTPGATNLVSAGFSQQVADTPTVQNAAYASGNCIGGFRAVTVTVNNGQSGYITNFRVSSLSGQTPTVTVYIFDSNPSSSTCTDKSTFTLANADVDKLLNNPGAATLAAPAGATASLGSLDFTPPRPFVAGGSTASGVKTIYYALVSGSTFTPGSTTDIHTRIGAALN